MAIKIDTSTENWPLIVNILHDFALHRDYCTQCGNSYRNSLPAEAYCQTGYEIIKSLSEFEEVTEIK